MRDTAAVEPVAATLSAAYPSSGGASWMAYPKKTGAIKSDRSRDNVWTALSAAGFLPVAQIAIDTTWSAVRFRLRSEIPKLARRTRE